LSIQPAGAELFSEVWLILSEKKIVFVKFFIRLDWPLVAGLNSEPQNIEFRRMGSLREIFFKTDRIPLFDVRCWTFDVGRSSVSSSIRQAAFQTSDGA